MPTTTAHYAVIWALSDYQVELILCQKSWHYLQVPQCNIFGDGIGNLVLPTTIMSTLQKSKWKIKKCTSTAKTAIQCEKAPAKIAHCSYQYWWMNNWNSVNSVYILNQVIAYCDMWYRRQRPLWWCTWSHNISHRHLQCVQTTLCMVTKNEPILQLFLGAQLRATTKHCWKLHQNTHSTIRMHGRTDRQITIHFGCSAMQNLITRNCKCKHYVPLRRWANCYGWRFLHPSIQPNSLKQINKSNSCSKIVTHITH